ncbi:hypothetical protein LOTGIDRAFT_172979 [Lottia gigantea]|uniref:Soluble interferon alpha/beta receptor OPG204 n=1 Tax=Lottia gigantea TaxID=225164 RepID=V4CFS6_LOTGI|nr:hypothetical protein LOTGIDRAFT_172979 [Lottia gigantea]ESP00880.1 hypothetical protein LOTGIDRAFT_172979 [Lottia gigantea]
MAGREVLCLVLILLVVSTNSYKCPQNDPSDELSFRGPPAEVVYVRAGQYKMIHCCTTGYTSMVWYKMFEDGYYEYPWYVGDDNVQEQQGNQSLRIIRSRKIKDGGWYKCVARNNSLTIKHEVWLNVIECETKNGRIDITQKPTGPIMAGIGERREITCEGNFGCLSGEEEDRIAEWRYKYKDDRGHWVSSDSRFTVKHYSKNNGTIVGNKLVIETIKTEDYDTVYSCILQTTKVGSRTGFDVTIIPPETIQKLYWLLLLLVPVVVMVTCLILYCLYKQRIDYFVRRKFGKFPDRGVLKNDILLLYNDADQTFVQNYFKPQLTEYKIFDKHCVLLGHREISKLEENIENSFATVLIYTRNFIRDKKLCYIFDIAKAASIRIFIVQIEDIPKNSVPDDLTDTILKKAPSIFTTIKWPWKDPKNSRKVKNFYCKLKKNLPREKTPKQCDSISRSSCRPLLASASSNGNEDDTGSKEPEVHHTRSRPTNIRVVTQTSTGTNNSRDSGISSPLNFNMNTEFPDIQPASVPINHMEIMV